MTQRCRTCSRVNPDEARFCHHDGTPLAARPENIRPLAAGLQPFLSPFVFPSGRMCRTFAELVLACEDDWDSARDLLRQGYLESFLAAIGRNDLALAARQSARAGDADRGLDEFLNQLPGDNRQPPRLRAHPLEVNLGRLTRGEDRHFVLHLENQGMGLLTGTAAVEDTPWLVLGDGRGSPRKVFQCRHNFHLPVRVHGQALRAANQPLVGRLSVACGESTLAVTVRCEVPVTPFGYGTLAGACSPREAAAKARAAPVEAAPLFEKGAVAAWYEANGWTYPVQGPPATGIGAVQQFFEALGLVTPPRVQISERAVYLRGAPGESLDHVLRVAAEGRRPVYAHATSGAPWLKIGRIQIEGDRARIPLRVREVPARPGEMLLGKVQVIANGNQRFVVDVTLQVLGSPSRAPAASPAAIPLGPLPADTLVAPPVAILVPPVPVPVVKELPVEPAPGEVRSDVVEVQPIPEPEATGERRGVRPPVETPTGGPPPRRSLVWMPLLPVAFIAIGLLATLARDLTILMHEPSAAGVEVPPDDRPRIALTFHDEPVEVTLGVSGFKPGDAAAERGRVPAVWEPSMRFGLVLLGPDGRPSPGRLTFEEQGLTNNVCVRLDGNEWLFGERPFRRSDGRMMRSWPGRWKERDRPLPSGRGRQSVWVYDAEQVEITQTVEIVRGPQSGLFDTCLVRYRIDNRDRRPHRVGLRFLLDTYIGRNDGVPFLIPGRAQLCSDRLDFHGAEVPDFIQALERENLADPGTVARVQLRPGGDLESPTRVTLGAWPNPKLADRDPRCDQEKTLWEVPVLPIRSLSPADSAVTIYWAERLLPPEGTREVGFTYGLGNVSSGEGGQLGLTVGGAFVPGGEFTVTALVSNPVAGQTVALTLPPEFELVEGAAEQRVPPLPPGAPSPNSPVSWRVRAGPKEGTYNIQVRSSTGVSQAQAVRIKVKGIFGD